MTTIRRVIVVASVAISLLPLAFQTALAQQGPPSDRPEQGSSHSADPCAFLADPSGAAEGIDKRCALGGSGGVGRGDFNNDGVADLAVGVPDEQRQSVQCAGLSGCTTTDHPGAGAVNVIYGGGGGLTPTGNQVLSQSLAATSTNAHYGRALAAGNFRGPGFASDLAVGAPGVRRSGALVGALYVHFSSSGRLSATPSQTFFADSFSTAGTSLGANPMDFPEDMTMVWGDFNGDDFGDLAAEVQNGGRSHEESKSAVLVLYGSTSGFNTSNFTLLVFDDGLGPDRPAARPLECDRLTFCFVSTGHVGLGAADLGGDGRDELLIGSPTCNDVDDEGRNGGAFPTGCAAVVPGKSPRLDHFGWDTLHPEDRTAGFGDGIEPGFGLSFAVGDFDGNGDKEVAIGAPDADHTDPPLSATDHVGAVWIFGLPSSVDPLLTQDDTGGSQTAEDNDRFGAALAANDFDGDGISDLAVGAPGESTGNSVNHGVVTVFYGSASGLPGTRTPSNWSIGSTGRPLLSNGAQFGASLSAWNFGFFPQADLAIGIPFFSVNLSGNTLPGIGGVLVVYGQSSVGLTSNNMQLWTQNVSFCAGAAVSNCLRTSGTARAGNHFGATVY